MLYTKNYVSSLDQNTGPNITIFWVRGQIAYIEGNT